MFGEKKKKQCVATLHPAAEQKGGLWRLQGQGSQGSHAELRTFWRVWGTKQAPNGSRLRSKGCTRKVKLCCKCLLSKLCAMMVITAGFTSQKIKHKVSPSPCMFADRNPEIHSTPLDSGYQLKLNHCSPVSPSSPLQTLLPH